MAQNSVLRPRCASARQVSGLVPVALAVATFALLPLQLATEAQEQTPAPAAAGGRRAGDTTWTAPFIVRLTITQQPGYQLYEYSYHEGNGAVGYALSGERAYEKMVEDAVAKGLPVPPRTMGMEVYSGAAVDGRQPVRVLGGGN